ncbi:MAG: phosphoenolpyruvate-utilizing N-terminal domain-containing protein, partial [Spirochaeta sp.]
MKHEQETDMVVLNGIPVSPGIAIGSALVFTSLGSSIPQYDISPADAENEIVRFQAALDAAIYEIDEVIRQKSDQPNNDDSISMLESHRLMLQDPDMQEQVTKLVTAKRQNVEWIFHGVIQEIMDKLNLSENEYLRERISDLQDVERRVLNRLIGRNLPNLRKLNSDKILICDDLMPSDAISMDTR